MNTTPIATDMCVLLARIVEPTAAMADPPQIAVPDEISVANLESTRIQSASTTPNANVATIVPNAKPIPVNPAFASSFRFIVAPSNTTHT